MGGDISEVDARRWSDGLAGLHERFAHRFARSEPRESALAYMRGLLAPLERKNGWTVAEEDGHTGPDRIQRLLNRIDWDPDGVLDDVREYVVEYLADPGGVLIVDDTGFLKKGVRSAGVQRQYSGTAGRTESCQVGVFLAYSTERGRTLIDRALYLPKSWTDDRERCRVAGIGEEVEFATKVQLARAMVRRAIDDKVPFQWVTADAGYGYSKGWRSELEQADVFHVVATTRHDTVVTRRALDHPLYDLVADLPRQKWKRRSCGEGAHGPRVYDWARIEARPWHRPDRKHWVLARRSITDPTKIAYYIAYAPAEATLNELIAVRVLPYKQGTVGLLTRHGVASSDEDELTNTGGYRVSARSGYAGGRRVSQGDFEIDGDRGRAESNAARTRRCASGYRNDGAIGLKMGMCGCQRHWRQRLLE